MAKVDLVIFHVFFFKQKNEIVTCVKIFYIEGYKRLYMLRDNEI